MRTPGLRQNLGQFALLVMVTAFVGGMVGLERASLPLLASARYGVASAFWLLSFIVVFGLVKALCNLGAGRWSERVGRKPLLVIGWLFALPVPALVAASHHWIWVVVANALLGINQGLCWSMTVVMKIDLVGPARRGLAMGLNEFAGYVSLSLATFVSAYFIARNPGLMLPLGTGMALTALLLSLAAVRESREVMEAEAGERDPQPEGSGKEIFLETSFRSRALRSLCQAGLVNNFNDAAAWGILPVFLKGAGATFFEVALVTSIYPAVWGLCQIGTGAWSDRIGRKWMIAAGMVLQGFGFLILVGFGSPTGWLTGAVLVGLGTAAVYPTLLAGIGDAVSPRRRATAVGVYRFWRDFGYALGGVLAGVAADRVGMKGTLIGVAFLTVVSGILVATDLTTSSR